MTASMSASLPPMISPAALTFRIPQTHSRTRMPRASF
nr:MAG TPA: hypothetical protein [Caudoviricetes sp.]